MTFTTTTLILEQHQSVVKSLMITQHHINLKSYIDEKHLHKDT